VPPAFAKAGLFLGPGRQEEASSLSNLDDIIRMEALPMPRRGFTLIELLVVIAII